jgi:geranylgeranyl transferase type-1 subunit beta
LSPGSEKFEMLLAWLASRQTGELGEEEEEENDEDDETEAIVPDTQPTEDLTRSLEEKIIALPGLTALAADSVPCAGFNGRCNKFADTCYSFWNGATLMVCVASRSA